MIVATVRSESTDLSSGADTLGRFEDGGGARLIITSKTFVRRALAAYARSGAEDMRLKGTGLDALSSSVSAATTLLLGDGACGNDDVLGTIGTAATSAFASSWQPAISIGRVGNDGVISRAGIEAVSSSDDHARFNSLQNQRENLNSQF